MAPGGHGLRGPDLIHNVIQPGEPIPPAFWLFRSRENLMQETTTKTEKPVVALVMPTYGTIHGPAARALYVQPTMGAVHLIGWTMSDSSFLPGSFNQCLIWGLNLRDEGRATHLAMIHSDIEPIDVGWIDQLYAEMQRTGATVVSAISPIKNSEGKTSTAIAKRDDPWRIVRHIGIDERNTLPDTFGPKDVCGEDEVLLINTGLWLADLRHPFWDTFQGFDTRCKIDREPAMGNQRRCFWRTEDWEWSRAMADAGVEYRATWTVLLHHHGQAFWSNY